MSDTAEYWHDVKNRVSRSPKIHMVHFRNSPCGHINHITRNTDTSEYLCDITCYTCVRLLKDNGNIYSLKEGVSPRKQSEIDKEKHYFRHGKCDCGHAMKLRSNSKTKEQFLGCSNYPTCKKNKSITTI